MPHESTVAHEQRLVVENPLVLRGRRTSSLAGANAAAVGDEENDATAADAAGAAADATLTPTTPGSLPHARALTPRKVTHNHDEDDSDDESSEKSS